MLQKLIERRRQGSEKGFTLIELMVVVLIIAILIAIAIPTFLGARGKAQNRSAQSNLRNALSAEKTVFTDNDQYTDVSATLKAAEPALVWSNGAFSNAPKNTISVLAETSAGGTTNDTITLGAKSDSGTCYYIKDVASSPNGNVTYADQTGVGAANCTAPSAGMAGLTHAFNTDQSVGWGS